MVGSEGETMEWRVSRMRLIDLPKSDQTACCVVCSGIGRTEAARLLDRDVGPVCYECFAELLNVEAQLRWQCLMDGGNQS